MRIKTTDHIINKASGLKWQQIGIDDQIRLHYGNSSKSDLVKTIQRLQNQKPKQKTRVERDFMFLFSYTQVGRVSDESIPRREMKAQEN